MQDETQTGYHIADVVPEHTKYLIQYLKKEPSHREKILQVMKHAEVNKGKVKSLSKRNQKRLLSRLGWYWNKETGNLVDRLKYTRGGLNSPYGRIPIESKFIENVGDPMTRMMDTWAKGLFNN